MKSKHFVPLNDLRHVARGFCMGGADIIPGVSGGTVALILGIYDRLVTAISHFDLQLLAHARRREWKDAVQHVDLRFLMALACGIALGVVGLASLMHYLLGHQETIPIHSITHNGQVLLDVDEDHGPKVGTVLLALRPSSEAGDYDTITRLRVVSYQNAQGQEQERALAETLEGVAEAQPRLDNQVIVIPSDTLRDFLTAPKRRMCTLATFFGLILASTVLVGRMIPRWTAPSVAALLAGAVFAFWLVGQPFLASPPETDGYVFFCGAVAICAMILPGISGAFVLLILGRYEYIAGLLRGALHGDVTVAAVVTLATFICGCAIGLLSFSKLLRWLLSRYQPQTLAALCGVMAGSLQKIWPFKVDLTPEITKLRLKQFENAWPDHLDNWVILATALACIAVVLVLALDRLRSRYERVSSVSEEE